MKKINLKCTKCNKVFSRLLSMHMYLLKKYPNKKFFCSKLCNVYFRGSSKELTCTNCNKKFIKYSSQMKKVKNNFCCKSCAATYNNTHKTTGNRRSKLEIWIENKLKELYPNIEILFNNKEIINSELDILLPKLNLAFELNGIYHYEPIHGKKLLKQIKNNDNRKFQACLEKNIELCIINTSKMCYFKESSAMPYFKIITNIIDNKYRGGGN